MEDTRGGGVQGGTGNGRKGEERGQEIVILERRRGKEGSARGKKRYRKDAAKDGALSRK